MTTKVSPSLSVPLGDQNALVESFSAIAEALTGGGDLATVLQCIAAESLRLLHATTTRVRMPDSTGTRLLLAAWADDEHAAIRLPPPDPVSFFASDSPAARAYRTNRVILGRGAPRRGVPEDQYAPHCTVPLTTRTRTLGVLTIWRTTEQPFSGEDVAIARIFGNAAALAMEQIRLLTEERDRTRRMETLTEVARIISAATDHDALYEAVHAQCVRLFGVEHFYIGRVGPDGELIPVLWYSYGHRLRENEGKPFHSSLGRCVVAENRPVNVPNAGAEYARRGIPRPDGRTWGESEKTFHLPWMGVPIRDGDRATGVIVTNGRATPYTEEECAVLRAVADQVGVAMRNIDLLEQQRERAARMATLIDVSRAISAATDLPTLYAAVHRQCSRLFSVKNFYIAHVRETTGEIVPDLWYSRGKRLPELEGDPLEGGLSTIVAATHRPFAADDYLAECERRGIPIYYPTAADDARTAWLGAPLMAGKTLLGVMVVSGKRGAYTAEEQEAFIAIANQVSIALTNARLLQEREARANRMATLAEVSRAISAMTDPDELYDVVYRECSRLLPMANSRICRIVPETGEIIAECWFRNGERVRESEGRALHGGLSPVIRDTGRPLLTNDYPGELVRRHMALPRAPLPPQDSSWLGVPVMQGNEVYGVISLNTTERRLTTEDRDTLMAVANQVGIAMANARLIARERERASRMATLTEVARSISAITDLETLYEAVYRQCARLFDTETFRITHIEEHTGAIVPDLWYLKGSRRRNREGTPLKGGLSFVVAKTRQPFATADYDAERATRGLPQYIPDDPGQALLTKAWLGAPLLAGETLLGVMAMYGKPSAYTPEEQGAFIAIANQVSVALQNIRLLERERTRAERLTALNEFSRTISAVLDLQPLLRAISRECARLLDLRSCFIGYRSADQEWMQSLETDGEPRIYHLDAIAPIAPLTALVMRTGAPLVERDYATACMARGLMPVPPENVALPLGWLGVPLFVGKRLIGAMTGFLPVERATPENAQIFSIIANQAAIAIENARLYHDAQELGVVEERNRLAREIHDTIAQGLTATTYQLELADTFLAMEPPKLDRAREKVQRSLALTRANLDEARRSVMDLRAAHLQGVTLPEAFERLAVGFTNDRGVTVAVDATEGFPPLPSHVSAGLYRIGQEALANIAKHAQATHVGLTLGIEESKVVLAIHDDGIGFDPQVVAAERTARGDSGGFGLIGIRERAQLLGGTSDISSDLGAGTRIMVRVPIKLVN